jgi:hypothetical protein
MGVEWPFYLPPGLAISSWAMISLPVLSRSQRILDRSPYLVPFCKNKGRAFGPYVNSLIGSVGV